MRPKPASDGAEQRLARWQRCRRGGRRGERDSEDECEHAVHFDSRGGPPVSVEEPCERGANPSEMVTELRALIFDFDGTIAETERDGHRLAYNAAFENLALPWRWDVPTYGALLATAGGRERVRGFIERERPDMDATQLDALAADVHAAKRRAFERFAGGLAIRPGVRRLIREARECGLKIAIATTAAPDGVGAVLTKDPLLATAFDAISAGDVVPHKKPAPDVYHHALAALGVRSAEAVAFEDSALGTRAALAAGLVTVVTPSVYTADESFAGAAAIVSDLGEPGAFATVLAGPSLPRGIVDVDYLRALMPS